MPPLPRTLLIPLTRTPLRRFSQSPRTLANGGATQDKKDNLLDKDSINTTSTEYSKTGAGDSGAAHTDKAFDPQDTSPGGQHEASRVRFASP